MKSTDYMTRRDLKEELVSFRDQILTAIDGVMKELEAMREDATIGTYHTRELRDKVNDHEKRITKLESSTS